MLALEKVINRDTSLDPTSHSNFMIQSHSETNVVDAGEAELNEVQIRGRSTPDSETLISIPATPKPSLDNASINTWRSHSALKFRERMSLLFSPKKHPTDPASAFIISDSSYSGGNGKGSNLLQELPLSPTAPNTTTLAPVSAASSNTPPIDVDSLLNTIHNQRPIKAFNSISVPSIVPLCRLVNYLFPEQDTLFHLERDMLSRTSNYRLRNQWILWTETVISTQSIESNSGTYTWEKTADINDKVDLNLCITDRKKLWLKNEKLGLCVMKTDMKPTLSIPSMDPNSETASKDIVALVRIPIHSLHGYHSWKNLLRFVVGDHGRLDTDLYKYLVKSSVCGVAFQKRVRDPHVIVISLMLSNEAFEATAINIDLAKTLCDMLHLCDPLSFSPNVMKRAKFDTSHGRSCVFDQFEDPEGFVYD